MTALKWLVDLVRRPAVWLVVPAGMVVLPLWEDTAETLFRERESDREQLFEKRLAPVYRQLAGNAVVGFLSAGGEVGDYMRAQYALVPLRVEVLAANPDLKPRFLVVYSEASLAADLGDEVEEYILQEDLGDGLYWYQRELAR